MSRARTLGSAHRGLTAFLIQRVTSLYLGGFAIYFVVYLIVDPVKNYATWTNYFASGGVRLAWALFFGSLLAHAWVGLRNIYMDYLHPMWLRFTVSAATALALSALAIWAAYILLQGGA